jgi:D-alanyl-D-alanine carboxypeptidase (penicillin-binding protein 5/6)
VSDGPEGTRRGPAHSRHGLSKESEARLQALSEQLPDLDAGEREHLVRRRIRPTVLKGLWRLVLVVVVALLAYQWLRPLPMPSLRLALHGAVRLPGTAPSLPWPTTGAATLSVAGGVSLGHAGSTGALPIAGLAKVLTAYTVLKDHPLALYDEGPSIAVDPPTLAAYQSGLADKDSEVVVTAGESLTEWQGLEGLLVASGTDMATLLADWDAGSVPGFVARMQAAARDLGLTATRVTDPSGLDPSTVSSPSDLLTLGEAAMANAVFRQIVAIGQATLPGGPTIYNFDYLVGHDGFVGISTGSDASAGGCFLFEAQRTLGGQTVPVIGVVLGQQGASPIEQSLEVADLLVNAAYRSLENIDVVSAGTRVGEVRAQWGASAPVTSSTSVDIVGLPGQMVPVEVRRRALTSSMAAGAGVGVLRIGSAGRPHDVTVRLSSNLTGPSVLWRLTRV